MTPISARELASWLGDPLRVAPLLLDVREALELAAAALPGAQHVPMAQVPRALGALDPARPVVCVCHHGVRSAHVAMFLAHHGFAEVYNLTGGIDAWSREVDPAVPVY